jgi:hypothetical protein
LAHPLNASAGAFAAFVDATPTLEAVAVHGHCDPSFFDAVATSLSATSKARIREITRPSDDPSRNALRIGLVALMTLCVRASDLGGSWWGEAEGPRESLRSLRVILDAPLPGGTNLRELFPNLESLAFDEVSATSGPFVGVVPALPRALTKLSIRGGGDDSSAFLREVLRSPVPSDPALPFLTDASLYDAGDPRVLIACAPTITALWFEGSEEHLAETIAALPYLLSLYSFSLSDCACAVGHPELRYIIARSIGPNITADRLARTCPRLHQIEAGDVYRHAVPTTRGDTPGWVAWEEPSYGEVTLLRTSHVRDEE